MPTATKPTTTPDQKIVLPTVAPTRLRDLTSTQWKSGIAAWLGWMFDGLDMHLYTLVATPFVAELLVTDRKDPAVGQHASWIQAAFLIGWALGGSLFGRLGDRLGRSRALVLTILTYACFTGLSYFAQTWWHLLVFRFLAALGIGGEWAVGAALLAETWPHRWRPWVAAVLQSAVNIGVMLACLTVIVLAMVEPQFAPRTVFLVGVLPALLVLWIRRAVPEPEEWHAAKAQRVGVEPGILDLFRGSVLRTTLLTATVCALSLTAHWAFMFWNLQHLRNLVAGLPGWTEADQSKLVGQGLTLLMVTAIVGNFLAAWIARWIGYRRTILAGFIVYFFVMFVTYSVERSYQSSFWWLGAMGAASGVFALFSMYLPPLFPTLLRTTGAGFCFNIGRIAAAFGTIFFGLFSQVGDYRIALLYAGFLFLPAAAVAAVLPELKDNLKDPAPVE